MRGVQNLVGVRIADAAEQPCFHQRLGDLVNVTRTHSDEQIVRLQPPPQFLDDGIIAALQVLHASDRVRDQFRGDPFDGLLARRVDRRDERHVRHQQRLTELDGEVARARVEVRLEERHDAATRIPAPGGVQRRPDLGRMVRVVIDDDRAGILAEDLKASIDAQKTSQPRGGGLSGDSKLAGHGDRRKRIAHVVFAGDEQTESSDSRHLECRSPLVVDDVRGPKLGGVGESVANDLWRNARRRGRRRPTEQLANNRIVHASDHRATRLRPIRTSALDRSPAPH